VTAVSVGEVGAAVGIDPDGDRPASSVDAWLAVGRPWTVLPFGTGTPLSGHNAAPAHQRPGDRPQQGQSRRSTGRFRVTPPLVRHLAVSPQQAQAARSQARRKILTTFVLRLTLLFTRSTGLVLHTLAQWAGGKDAKAVRSSRASSSIVATAGNFGCSMAATLSTCSQTSAPVGWAKIVRIAAATISAEPLGGPWPARSQEVQSASLPGPHRP
jgi:hypothetical protein